MDYQMRLDEEVDKVNQLLCERAALTAAAAKWQRLYLDAVSELAVNRALLEDAVVARENADGATKLWISIVNDQNREYHTMRNELRELKAATMPQGD